MAPARRRRSTAAKRAGTGRRAGRPARSAQPPEDDDLPLSGVRVVALEQAVAAPFCTRQLADLGADVVKIERPDGGDLARAYDSTIRRSVCVLRLVEPWQAQRGPRSQASGMPVRSAIGSSIAGDVLVHNLTPGAIERLGFGVRRGVGPESSFDLVRHLRVRPRWSVSREKGVRHACPG